MKTEYDIIIVGGGPAGATLARLSQKSERVLLLDGSSDGKPCGGLLAPDAQKALARFDLTLPKDVLVDPQIFSVKTIDVVTEQIRWYQRMYINVDRKKFDDWLISLVPENVTIRKARCASVSRTDGSFTVQYWEQGVLKTATAACIVGADGANSTVRKSLFSPLKTRRYIAVQQWFRVDAAHSNPFYSCIFDPEVTDCCSWSIYKDGFLIFGGAFAPEGCRDAFEREKLRLAPFGFSFGEPVKTEACQVLRPQSTKSFCCGSDGAFLLGEAAGFISPSSLEGISSAIESAVALREALDSRSQNTARRYLHNTRRLRVRLLTKNLKCPFMYTPFLRKLVLASGLSSIDIHHA